MTNLEILVLLLDEGTDVFVEAQGEELSKGLFIISGMNETFDATPEFVIGDVVRISRKEISGQIMNIACSVYGERHKSILHV
jgi:hypothetical protein